MLMILCVMLLTDPSLVKLISTFEGFISKLAQMSTVLEEEVFRPQDLRSL